MKQTPEEKRVQNRMQPGELTLEGFLGNDTRHYHEIIEEDENTLKRLGITHIQIADKLQELTDSAFECYDGFLRLENDVTVEYISVRGKLPSPFTGEKPAAKGVIRYFDPHLNIRLNWTPLNIQMIRNHGFFEGKGSANRLDPVLLYEVFFSE